MSARPPPPLLTPKEARKLLGVGPLATAADVRRGFREAAKRAHPDRPGGGDDAFRRVMEAYRMLGGRDAPVLAAAPPPPKPTRLEVSPADALLGGLVDLEIAPGRRLRINLPAGVRHGERITAGELKLTVAICALPDIQVRGDDLWMSVRIAPEALAAGGRAAVETPVGRRIVWITREAGERGLLRLAGQGLPPRGPHARGHLFLRLAAAPGPAQSKARDLLDRFAAAWAA